MIMSEEEALRFSQVLEIRTRIDELAVAHVREHHTHEQDETIAKEILHLLDSKKCCVPLGYFVLRALKEVAAARLLKQLAESTEINELLKAIQQSN